MNLFIEKLEQERERAEVCMMHGSLPRMWGLTLASSLGNIKSEIGLPVQILYCTLI